MGPDPKLSSWDDRAKEIAKDLKKFNNETLVTVEADRQTRFGAKGKDKF